MAKTLWNIVKANQEIGAADAAIDAALVSAKITVVKVDGKETSLADAPLAAKISALAGLVKVGDSTGDTAELIATNGQLASRVEDLEGKLSVESSKAAALAREKTELEAQSATQAAAVSELTKKNVELGASLEASTKEAVRVTGELNKINTEFSRACLAANCLDLGLKADASDADKLAAADKISLGEKMTAYKGAVTAALARAGVTVSHVPMHITTTANGQVSKTMTYEAFKALEPDAQRNFFATGGKLKD